MKTIDSKYNVVFIDFDGTLVDTQSGETFPKCIADMKILWPTWNALRDWAKNKKSEDIHIYIVSNQAGISEGYVEDFLWRDKATYITSALFEYIGKKGDVDFDYAVEKTGNKYKPSVGMLETFTNRLNNPDKSEMVMIGDAADINKDFSDSDYKTAKNFGIDFIDVKDLWE